MPENVPESLRPSSTNSARVDTLPLPVIRRDETTLSPEYVAAHAEIPSTQPSGGDFHHAFPLGDGSGNVAVVIGDVAGHGPAQTPQADHMRELLADCLDAGLSPAETLSAVNALIEPDPNFEGFGTVFVGTIEPDTGTLTYASGGHEPALIAAPVAEQAIEQAAVVEELIGTGPPVGAFPPEIARYEQQQATLPEGGTLLLYTDGVSDARPPHTRREWLGVDGLKRLLAPLTRQSPARLVTMLLRRVLRFCRGRFDDDVAVLAIRRRTRR